MSISYRSGSNRLTDNQIDNNFRFFTGSRSITGSFTLSGSLIPSNPEFSLGSSDNPFSSLYLSNNITIVSGSHSASMGVNLNTLQPPTASIYSYLDLTNTPFVAPVLSKLESGEWFTTFADLTSSWTPNDLTPEGYLLPSPYWWVNESLANNGGGMGIFYDTIVTGQKWLDRSRAYATDGVDLTATQSAQSQGWWNWNSELTQAITGKTPFIWDNQEARLWHFSDQPTYFTSVDHPTTYASNGRKATYFHLLTSGSAFDDSTLEQPFYEDDDILVRMWNENITQYSYWFTLEYNENNVHYYNTSESYDSNGYASYFQDSINPGRVHLANNYKGKRKKTNPWQPQSNQYDYTWDYNAANPFYSSSCLLLSLKAIAGPYIYNGNLVSKAIEDGYGPFDSPTSQQLLLFSPTNLVVSGSQAYPVMDWDNTGQYGKPTNLSNYTIYPNGYLSPPFINQNIWNKSYPYLPFQTNTQAGLNAYGPYTAWGYHQLQLAGPWGSCTVSLESSKTGVQIMPLIPLTTAHYPISASSFWYTASLSSNNLVFSKPNRSTFSINLPTGSSNTLYAVDGTLPDNRIVDLNGYDLTFSATTGETFTIDADPLSEILITGLTTSSYSTLVGYNATNGLLSSTGTTNEPNPYFYSTGSTDRNNAVSGSVTLTLGEVYNYNSPTYLLFDSSVYTVKTAGKYYINVNGTLGQDTEVLSQGLGWWKVSLQVNGTTVAEASAKQSGVNGYYGGLDLMYVGDFSINDQIKIVSDTSNPTATSTISNTKYRFSAEYLGI